ncbi:MAG: hypothetical protein K2J33_00425, partial [Alistipes sp.]|nr:hypothetical protein [Alistipes sp.]
CLPAGMLAEVTPQTRRFYREGAAEHVLFARPRGCLPAGMFGGSYAADAAFLPGAAEHYTFFCVLAGFQPVYRRRMTHLRK